MRYKKSALKEEGFLLLESLLTLVILMTVVTVLCPLLVNWLSKHREAKSFVEETRQLYESSVLLNNGYLEYLGEQEFTFQIDKHCIQINETGTEVVIYESVFEK